MPHRDPRAYVPDVADGLTGMLYGSVVEHVDMSVEEMQGILVRLIGHPLQP